MKKNLLSENIWPRVLIYWYVASPGGQLPSLSKLCPWGQKLPHPCGHMFYIGLYGEQREKNILV